MVFSQASMRTRMEYSRFLFFDDLIDDGPPECQIGLRGMRGFLDLALAVDDLGSDIRLDRPPDVPDLSAEPAEQAFAGLRWGVWGRIVHLHRVRTLPT